MRTILMLVIDLVLVVLATISAFVLRHDFSLPLERFAAILPYMGYTVAFALLAIIGFGQHRAIWRLSAARDYRRVFYVAIVAVAGATATGFIIDRLDGVPRSLPLLQIATIAGLMLAARALTRKSRQLRRHRRTPAPEPDTHHGARSNVLVVGLNSLSELYLQAISEFSKGEIEIAGILGRNARQVGRLAQSHRVLGLPEDLVPVLRDLEIEGVVVDRIVVAVPMQKLSAQVRETLHELERETTIVVQVLADSMGLGAETPLTPLQEGDLRALEFTAIELGLISGRQYFRLKRAFDVVLALILLVVAAPFVALVALLVAVDVGAPIVFGQRRPGKWGRPFKVFKFRTMAGAYDRDGRRIDDAERSSSIGKFLRRTRLDELPQLYNVLVGDMSFVGPRPLLPIDQGPEFKARLLVRPGITGYAQVEGGRIIEPADKAAMDVWYVQNASLALDLRVMARTLPMMLFGDRVNQRAIEQAWGDLATANICRTWVRPEALTEGVASPARPRTSDTQRAA
jgi:lipopolysaccharide/colanic/teichoic acid biosynthesis glycosyltransferase